MSIKSILGSVFAASIAGFAIAAIILWPTSYNSPDRGPAAVSKSKRTLKSQGLKMGKLDRPMEISIINLENIPVVEPRELHLRGYVSAQQNTGKDIEFRWILPKGVSILAGQIEGNFRQIPNGQDASSDITVAISEQDAENHIIIFESFYMIGDTRIANSAVYNVNQEIKSEEVGTEEEKAQGNDDASAPRIHY